MAVKLVRPTKYNFQSIPAGSLEYHSVGPFAEGELLESLRLDLTASVSGTIEFAPVLQSTRYATVGSVEAGTDLIAESDLLFANTRALAFTPAAGVMVSLSLVLNVRISSGPRWMHFAVRTPGAVTWLHLLVGVVVGVGGVVSALGEEVFKPGEPAVGRVVSPLARPEVPGVAEIPVGPT